MASCVYPVSDAREYKRAGPSDLIQLQPVPGTHPLFLPKVKIETLVYAIVARELVHLSGPTGCAKSSLLEALFLVPENFTVVCAALGFEPAPLKLYPIEMATYEAPGELYQRRALKNGTTFDEQSALVQAILDAAEQNGECYPLIWLREIGRVHSASVQGGLLDLMTKCELLLPGGHQVDGRSIAWVADSNYQAETDATHTLVTLDDALKRRFTINLTLDYLTAEQEELVIRHLIEQGRLPQVAPDLVARVVRLGQRLRRQRAEGNLDSLPPPTLYGYLSFLRMAHALPHLSSQHIASATLLGNASTEDSKAAASLLNQVFGLQADEAEDPIGAGGLF